MKEMVQYLIYAVAEQIEKWAIVQRANRNAGIVIVLADGINGSLWGQAKEANQVFVRAGQKSQ